MKRASWLAVLLLAGIAVAWLGASQAADKAKDPVCGMSVDKASAKWTYDYKGTTYYFCGEGCKDAFVKEPDKYLAKQADTAKAIDPVCGMSVDKATAKWKYDYKGTTYYFCGEGCKTSFAKEPEKYLAKTAEGKPMGGMMGQGMMHGQMMHAQAADPSKAIDPVCGMSVDKAAAKWKYDYKGTTYYFCSEGCKTSFAKEPEKYLAKTAEGKPMGGMMGQGMMHGQMMEAKSVQGQPMHAGMAGCPMMLPDVERKIETVKDGIVVTLTSKNAETVKKLQEHAAQMKGMMKGAGKDAASGPMAKCEGGCAACAGKK